MLADAPALSGRHHDLLDLDDLVHEIADATVLSAGDELALDAEVAAAAAAIRARRPPRRPRRERSGPAIREYWTADLVA